MDNNSLSHTKYNYKYHIVFAPKFRRKEIYGELKKEIGNILRQLCEWKGVTIIEAHACVDHIHIFVDCPQTVAPCDIVRTLKSISAIEMFKAYPQLKQFYSRCGVLWSRGYFVSTVGHISEATVKKYIEEQKDHE
ncbi:MAG: IS200/IS605 family transposase [Clostridiales bacterium 36_14]|nr:MAG: IS200/IS605 family transposase [Clostridiales bacterium 36_14]